MFFVRLSRHPIHLAVLGGNLKLVKWLASERFCPLRAPKKRNKKTDGPILTSKGRSPLAVAMIHQRLDIVQYLVADMRVSLFDEKEMNSNVALANFTSLLKMLPADFFNERKIETTAVPNSAKSLRHNGLSFSPGTSPANSTGRRPSM
jgi:hypothetical protein